ncbi:MAG: hypothetical protein VX498_08105, partial [Myxococcota bacterium]|nr:hypothetical protein [Myxococcota bacterium]
GARPQPDSLPRDRGLDAAAGAGMKQALSFALLLILLVIPLSATAAEAYGTLTLVQVRRAGFLEEVKTGGSQVGLERDGERLPAERGMTIQEGDILVTERGSCVVTTPEGWRVTVGEGTRLEVQTTWVQRLGTAIYRVRESFRVRVERVEVLVEGTVFRVTWDGENGEVAVTEGIVRVRGEGGAETLVHAGERAAFTAASAGGAGALTASERVALATQERQLASANGGFRSRAGRLRIGLGGGIAIAQGRTWGTTQLRTRIRLAGPLWANISGGLLLRPLAPEDPRFALAFPLVFGLQRTADLPGGVTGTIGGSLDLLIGERCVQPVSCERVVSAEPGGTLDLGLGFLIGRHLAISAEGRFGAGLRREYGEAFQLSPDAILAPRLDLSLWVEVRL